MPRDQIPTVFVALVLAPDQYDLFDEIQTEAMDILEDRPVAMRGCVSGAEGVVLLDCDCVRIALRWTDSPQGDVLTLAIGSRPDLALPRAEAREAADMLRQLVKRAEALFQVEKAIWQIAMLPLVAGALNTHVDQLGLSDVGEQNSLVSSFVTFEPGQAVNPDPAKRDPSAADFLTSLTEARVESETEQNWAMKASTFALSTAFVLVTPPVGIAMFTYAALRQGTDMGLLPREFDRTPSRFAPAGLPA